MSPMVNGTPALDARGLRKRYGRTSQALRSVDVDIPAGTVTALVGPNGAGKSTLIRSWATLESPTAGSVHVWGLDPRRSRKAVLGRIGYVPQTPALYRELTVLDHLDFAASMRGSFDKVKARWYLDHFAVPVNARGRELSGGQQAQVSLALALSAHADVLLLDEPLASLDPLARREFLRLLAEEVGAAGATAVLSSHVVTDIEQVCDWLLVLGGGRALLHAEANAALRQHSVSQSTPPHGPGEQPIGTFPGPSDGSLTLWSTPQPGGVLDARPASLEELVLGYLASGRTALMGVEEAAR